MVEVALRDCRNIDVIMAMDRLVFLPANLEGMTAAMEDMKVVKDFAALRVPQGLREVGKEVFLEHASELKTHLTQNKES
ncbi:hypothetical protein B1808_14760 [Pseudofulvimonas gallinarii]|uniref:Uncharacterized protein n=1 Tax=Pseudoxanthomonas kaohsiungensis TaxID=283923 RepID=A0ABW3LXN3_9GAMM|nr:MULTISPECIES: hypothetical protein [Xanthomonadales]KAF1702951.1 hypothetical protein CSC66_09255 [Pseudoxanthomonas kaohsiungensis]THD10612.1 hypothetical protein B1808_14760 [Pseudofulvimonas gallinarii]